ncbi:UNKNOWN [Stylonychia lemnae]|uniref:Uncharacterized protein n=1 Tax=Stylonychia lemnae TaxID=5949 RepID=A0A078AT29_STYLE|nr:UNKNOWN [Stylonychia lemnae]|eukprot:CDW84028.1 UNKNOWN [Stylonychia lemnae]
MGGIASVLDSCGGSQINTPSDFVEYENLRESRKLMVTKKKHMDIMGTALSYAVEDIKHIIGMKDHHSDNEEQANEDEHFLDMSKLKQKYIKRRDSDQSISSNYLQRREDLYNDYIERKKKEKMLRQKKKVGMANTKLRPRKMDQKISNPAAGISLGFRGFGKSTKQTAGNTSNRLVVDADNSNDGSAYIDDDLSDGSRIIKIGGQSEYSQDQSFLSIRQFESQDGDSQIYRNDSDSSMNMTDIKRNQSNWDAGSMYSDGNIINMGGDGDTSFQSNAMSETTIKNIGGQQSFRQKNKMGGKKRIGGMRSRVQSSVGGSSHVIVDDFQSQGYGMDSEIDAQDMIDEMGGNQNIFIEGESDIIDEADEDSIDNLRRSSKRFKRNKSFGDEDQIEGPVNQQDFVMGIMHELQESEIRASIKRVVPPILDPQQLVFKDVKQQSMSPQNKNSIKPNLKKLDSKTYVPKGQEIFHEESGEEDSEEDQSMQRASRRHISITVKNTETTPMNHQNEKQTEVFSNDDDQISGGSIKIGGNSFNLNDNSQFSDDGDIKNFGDKSGISQIDENFQHNLSAISDNDNGNMQ